MTIIQLLTSLGLVALAKAAITPLQQLNVTVTNQDLIQFNLSSLFNMGGNSNPNCSTYQTPGDVLYYNSSIFTRSLPPAYINEPEIVNFVSNTTFFSIFENTYVMIQSVNLDAESFGPAFTASFATPGIQQVCTDVSLNSKLNRLYIVCQSNFTAPGTQYIYFYEVDATNGTVYNKFNQPQNATLKVSHRMQLTYAPILNRQTRQVTHYVIAYDQGMSGGLSVPNKWALIMIGADYGNLTILGVADFSVSGLTILNDIFNVRGSLLVTGKNSSVVNSTMVMADCFLQISGQGNPSVQCSPVLIPAPFGTYYGYIGVLNTGQYVEVNANANNIQQDLISICNFYGEWPNADFIDTTACNTIGTSNIPNDVFVSTVEGNAHQIVISYVYADATYAGYTVENFDIRVGFWDLDDALAPHYVPIGKSLIRVNSQQMDIFRMVPPYLFVQARNLKYGVNLIRVNCQDPVTGQVSQIVNITVLASMCAGVTLRDPNLLPQISMYEGQEYFVPFRTTALTGNDLRTVISPLTNQSIAGEVYDNRLINIDFNVVKGSTAFVDIHFADKYAVAKDINDFVIFFTCQFVGLLHASCNETYAYSTAGSQVTLKPDVETVFGNLFVWGVDNSANVTYLWFYDGMGTVTPFVEGGAADDCAASTVNGIGYIVCAFSERGIVRGWNFTATNFAGRQKLPDIYRENSGREYFCPQTVEFDMDTSEMIEVFSFCPNQDQRILRYRYPPTQSRQSGAVSILLAATVPINFAYTNVQICSMGYEFVIFSTLGSANTVYSQAMWDDRNQWFYGTLTDDISVGPMQWFNCVRNSKAFTVYSRDANQNAVITTYYGNRHWRANEKIFTTMRANSALNPEFAVLNNYKFFYSYDFMGMVLHTMATGNPMDPMTFALSFIESKILHLWAPFGMGNTTQNVEIDTMCTTYPQNNTAFYASVNTNSANLNGSVVQLGTTNGIPVGTVQLEQFLKFNGPISHAWLSHDQYNKIQLQGRLAPVNNYLPNNTQNQYTFDWLWTVESTTVALHRYQPYNTSVFTIFNQIDNLVGTYTPPDAVHTFHFAAFNNTDNNTILLAMSTAKVSNSSLDFLAINGTQRIAIGFSNDNITMSYDKIRVVPYHVTGNEFLVMALNKTNATLFVFLVTYNGTNQLSSQIYDTIGGVSDFTYAVPTMSQNIYLFYVERNDPTNVQVTTFGRITGEITRNVFKVSVADILAEKARKEGVTGPSPSTGVYPVTEIEARIHNQTSLYLLINSKSIYIFETIINTVQISATNYWYYKVPGWDGRFIDGNRQHIMQMTGDLNYSNDIRMDFYLRQVNGGDGQVWWTQHNDQFRPSTLTTCQHNMSHVQMTTPFANMPLVFLKLQPMTLQVENGADFTNAILSVQGIPHSSPQQFNLSAIIGGNPSPSPGDSVKWWPFVLLIGVLVVSAVGFIVYNGMKSNAAQKDDPENYESLKPQSKDA